MDGSVNAQQKYEEIVSSLGLQISLYFHWRFSLIFVAFYVLKCIIMKADLFADFVSMAAVILLTLWSVIEAWRIYLGYAGNLREQVPHLFGFLFLSIFPQFLLVVVVMGLQWQRSHFLFVDKILGVLQILFLLSQLIFGYIAIRSVINAQTLKFKIKTKQRAQLQQQQNKLLGSKSGLHINPNDIKHD